MKHITITSINIALIIIFGFQLTAIATTENIQDSIVLNNNRQEDCKYKPCD
jgi:hypothetical protein